MFINHRRCPECGYRLKHYYWYCGQCGNQSLTNWIKTLVAGVIFIAILTVGATFVHNTLCSNDLTAKLVNNITKQFLTCE